MSYTILLTLICTVWGKAQKTTLHSPFTFLVTGQEQLIAHKAESELIQATVSIDFDKAAWGQLMTDMRDRYAKFETLSFFSDATLKAEFVSYTGVGFYHLASSENLITGLLDYKDENFTHSPFSCEKTLVEIKNDELVRLRINLDFRFSQIKATWLPTFVATDTDAQEIILSWVTLFNEGAGELAELAMAANEALEALTSGSFPAKFLGKEKGCKSSISHTEGELFKIGHCAGHKKGYSCLTELIRPQGGTNIQPLYTVAYDGIQLTGAREGQTFAKNTATAGIMYIDCIEDLWIHPLCSIETIPVACRNALTDNHIESTIKNCNFTTSGLIPPYIHIANGGIFVNKAQNIQAGTQIINDPLPLIIYTADTVTITTQGQEYKLYPEQTASANIIIHSSLTEHQIAALRSQVYWDDVIENTDSEDWIDYSLIFVQLLSIPFLGVAFAKSLSRKKRQTKGKENIDKGEIYKMNMRLLRGK